MKSLRTKLTLLISFLIILVIGVNTGIVLQQKYRELNEDIFRGAVSFAKLVSRDVVQTYRLNYSTNSFLKLPGDIKNLLELNLDISNVKIAEYNGNLSYDFLAESTEKYQGEQRVVTDPVLLTRIKSNIPSVMTTGGNVVFFEQKDDGTLRFLDRDGRPIENGFNLGQQFVDLVYPVQEGDSSYALEYQISYDILNSRIFDTTVNTLLITIFSVLAGIFVAFFFASKIIHPLKKLTASAMNISKGRFGQVISIKSKDEVGRLAKSFNKMSVELKSATDQLVQKERLAKEIELASKIQDEFLPKEIPQLGGMDIHAGVISADAVGGDLYDFITLSEEKLLFYIGDVTGHGVSAGLVTAIANSIIYSYSYTKEGHDVRDLSVSLNRVMRAKTRPDMFITAFIGEWDAKKSTLTYTPCGHEPTYIYNPKKSKLRMLKKEGIALGMVDGVEKILKKDCVSIDSGDIVVMYTDGIPEAWNADKEMYGFDRLEESIKRHGGKSSAKEIYEGILDDVYKFMGGYPQADDVTLVVMKKG